MRAVGASCNWRETYLGTMIGQRSAECGAQGSIQRPEKLREPFPGGPDPSTQSRGCPPCRVPGTWIDQSKAGSRVGFCPGSGSG